MFEMLPSVPVASTIVRSVTFGLRHVDSTDVHRWRSSMLALALWLHYVKAWLGAPHAWHTGDLCAGGRFLKG